MNHSFRRAFSPIAGPVCVAMTANFEAFWTDRRAFPTAGLADVARVLIANKGPPPAEDDLRTPRAEAMRVAAEDSPAVFWRLSPFLLEVGRVDFFGDLPNKHPGGLCACRRQCFAVATRRVERPGKDIVAIRVAPRREFSLCLLENRGDMSAMIEKKQAHRPVERAGLVKKGCFESGIGLLRFRAVAKRAVRVTEHGERRRIEYRCERGFGVGGGSFPIADK